ncbi:hypothetical protein BAU28_19700 [Bacillus paramycoides]|uniref:Uncharacterized protein n=1 Tax=Bacillus paramycoides TaxID=2026194 RepID=A0A1J9UUS4_9BACI|nr:hypothetical protein BAU28_19700 [Bacillus paramycoides]
MLAFSIAKSIPSQIEAMYIVKNTTCFPEQIWLKSSEMYPLMVWDYCLKSHSIKNLCADFKQM